MEMDGRARSIIENVEPEINGGRFPIKRVAGERIVVRADVYSDGHDEIAARLLFKGPGDADWRESLMEPVGNDRWEGEFSVDEVGNYLYTVQGWVDHFKTWRKDLKKKFDAGRDLEVDFLIGAGFLDAAAKRSSLPADAAKLARIAEGLKKKNVSPEEKLALALGEEIAGLMEKYPDKSTAALYEKELPALSERKRAGFSAWYEFFPRSCSTEPGRHGTLKDCEALLPEIARMGFDILYLPPIHPIGEVNRKGKNNAPRAEEGDVGSPWAIGSQAGGHKALHPRLGSMEDFEALVKKARDLSLDIALDLALQCAPDHPYVKEHPEWFRWRPDGTVQYAENPPKKYEDILPIHFETKDWKALWEELRSVVLFWTEKGVRVFRVDNPHTKPFPFWEWLIAEVKKVHPDAVFLSEAFTRPKVMYRLAKLGFTQSYTYFTWRNSKTEIIQYLKEITQAPVREFFRPNFWPNTPDILPEYLQYGGRPAFVIKLVLAATLSSNYGVYGPAYELCEAEPLSDKEEYLHSEKYEIKHWDRGRGDSLRDLMARLNSIRRENAALHSTLNLEFHAVDNDHILFYIKATEDLSNVILVVVNLDPFHTQAGWVEVPMKKLGIDSTQPYLVHDLLSDDKYIWQGVKNYVELKPEILPAHIFQVRKRLKREYDFDYFM